MVTRHRSAGIAAKAKQGPDRRFNIYYLRVYLPPGCIAVERDINASFEILTFFGRNPLPQSGTAVEKSTWGTVKSDF